MKLTSEQIEERRELVAAAARMLGRNGCRATSAKKTAANKVKMVAYWASVKAGAVPEPRHKKGKA